MRGFAKTLQFCETTSGFGCSSAMAGKATSLWLNKQCLLLEDAFCTVCARRSAQSKGAVSADMDPCSVYL